MNNIKKLIKKNQSVLGLSSNMLLMGNYVGRLPSHVSSVCKVTVYDNPEFDSHSCSIHCSDHGFSGLCTRTKYGVSNQG
jgi:hypothetical protein